MKIAIVQALYPQSGAGAAARELADGLSASHEVHVFHGGPVDSDTREGGLRLRQIRLPDPKARWRTYVNPAMIRTLADELAAFKPDVLHFHVLQNNTFSLASLLLARRYPTVWTLHDYWALCVKAYPEPSSWRGSRFGCLVCTRWPVISAVNKIIKESVYLASPLTVVTPSAWLAGEIRASTLGRLRTVHVVPYGIDCARFSPAADARRELELAPEKKMVLFMGGEYAERKGLDDLVAALEGDTDIELWVAGHAPGGSFPAHVRFLGNIARERTPLYYSAADVIALPSKIDNLPLVALEAGACGRPVVGYRAGGIPEEIVDGETGRLVELGDRAGLGRAIRELAADRAASARMGAAARAHIEKHFARDVCVQRMLAIYREVAGA